MAGFWHQSFQQLHDLNGRPYPGARAFFYAADSLDPITVYQDYGLGTEHPNPVVADAFGVFPAVFLDEDDGFYRQRITTSGGVIIAGNDLPVLPVVGPGDGGGGAEVPVDTNALFKTGFVLWLDQTGNLSGWVRDNGRTVGSATSGASERANSDTESLFGFLWTTYSNTICPVNGGRGLSSAADWSANKTIGLPDKRGYVVGGLDDMGNSAASRFTGVPVVLGSVTDAGSVIGAPTHTLLTAELAAHTHVANVTDPGHIHRVTSVGSTPGSPIPSNSTGSLLDGTAINSASATTGISVTNVNAGGGGSHNNVQGTVLGTFYRKL